MNKSNETLAFYLNKCKEDKALFVENLGWLLSQTREQVVKCEYIPKNELVKVIFEDGYEKLVNINLDSYLAIIKDVVRAI